MKITQVDLYEVEIPPIPPIARYHPKIYDITLCRVQTDDGLAGWGELQGPRSSAEEQATALVGEDPLALDPYARPDAFTCALLDIAGQAYDIPLHRFFGAQVRDKVPVSYWSCHMEPHETAAEASVGASLGFTNHKLKARSWDIVETVRLMKEVAGADYTIGVDPNTEFALLPNAARLAGELEPFGTVSVFEDPMLKNNLEWYRILREKTHIPIALHLGAPSGVLAALKAECIDYLNLGGSALQVRTVRHRRSAPPGLLAQKSRMPWSSSPFDMRSTDIIRATSMSRVPWSSIRTSPLIIGRAARRPSSVAQRPCPFCETH